MDYPLKIHCHGNCKGNGRPDGLGVGVALIYDMTLDETSRYSIILPSTSRHTTHRAELMAVIVALQRAAELGSDLTLNSDDPFSTLDVNIYSDSEYVIGVMSEWAIDRSQSTYKWKKANGRPIMNWDLVQRASILEAEVRSGGGDVSYELIERKDNGEARNLCREVLNMWD